MQVSREKPKTESETDTRTTKEKLWEELQKMSDAVITLAFMYARGYDIGGEDVTKEWTNAIRNTQIIETAYRRGYEDAMKDFEAEQRRDFYHKVVYSVKKERKRT